MVEVLIAVAQSGCLYTHDRRRKPHLCCTSTRIGTGELLLSLIGPCDTGGHRGNLSVIKSNRGRARSTLLSGILNFGVDLESYRNHQNVCTWAGGFNLGG
jgi:hypothetical protein